jgi:hypothetical protein
MAVLKDLGDGWGITALVGLGVIVAAPVLLPVLGAVVRPVAKGFMAAPGPWILCRSWLRRSGRSASLRWWPRP